MGGGEEEEWVETSELSEQVTGLRVLGMWSGKQRGGSLRKVWEPLP